MDTQKHGNTRASVVEKHQEGRDAKPAKQQEVIASPASPPSVSSSPSHEFSFTISVRSSSTPTHDKTTTPHHSFAIDLTPADDIFFHGHLLPLHLLSHLSVSPPSSINSLDSFTLPIGKLLDDQRPGKDNTNPGIISSDNGNSNIIGFGTTTRNNTDQSNNSQKRMPKSFSLFRRRKGSEVVRGREKDRDKQKTKLKFDLNRLLKRYVRMFFKGRKDKLQFQTCSFSGNLSWKNKWELRGRRGKYSDPASMRTSPTNSGRLVATPTFRPSTSDSTMEELQAAIQAAIAHYW